tara:strand:- start:5188 stop:5784 length:597 start_codon:yes stop_codon:yes gene_type:complete
MIRFIDIEQSEPYKNFNSLYKRALKNGQRSIEAFSISSFDSKIQEVQSRYVNLKYVIENEWIFFSNYNSPKSKSFESHNQITALFFWPYINSQIRIKATIKKTTADFNNDYFKKRSPEKNALAISSCQSEITDSYESVVTNFSKTLKSKDLMKCPHYWGGFSFSPYYFEFWEGHESRLNKREIFKLKDGEWEKYFIQP